MKTNKIKIMPVFGTRPDAVKMAPLIKYLEKTDCIHQVICTTGQHKEMLKQVTDIFKIIPDHDLKIMKKEQSLEYITHSILEKMGDVLDKEKPDMVLVHGDTASCFICALCAFYRKIPVGHVEAGLRTNDIYSPFPEEMNRQLTARVASLHFAPTKLNKENLLKEGISESNIYVTGNTVIDALKTTVTDNYNFNCKDLNKVDYVNKRVITLTAHRRENLGEPLNNICKAVLRIAKEFSDVFFIWPVHLSRSVQEPAYSVLGNTENILLTDPIDVRDTHNLMNKSYMVMTDSGGLQEEAPALGKPVLVLRKETERPEAIAAGTVKLSGTDEQDIYKDAKALLTDKEFYNKMAEAVNPYGDGNASRRITESVLKFFNIG